MDYRSARYAPMNRSHIPGFPNRIPHIDWQKYFPKFKDGKGNDVALHLIRFHMHICKLGVEFHEDCLMKMFMATLEGKARLWYEGLKPGSLYSLKYFHITFFKHYGESNPSFLVFEDCCEFCEHFIKYLENVFGDEECMNDEIIEAFYEYSSQQQIVAPPLVEDEVDQEIVAKSHFPSPELDEDIQQDFQQDKVFQSCLSSPVNDVVVQILSGLDMDEDSETASMETSSSEQTNDIEFQESNKTVYATFQSEIQKDNEEAVVLFDSFENHGFENASMGTLDCEIVHDVSFSHLQEYYEQELISIHSFESQNDSPQANFQKVNKTKSELFDEQEDSLDAHNMVVIFEDVQECMNVFVDMHGRVDKPIASISFENVLRTEEIEQEQQTLMKEACLSVFVHQEEMIFHGFQDPVAILLQSSVKEEFVSFISSDFGFNFCFQLPSFTFVCLLKKNVSRGKSGSQLLDWLHWHFSIT
jgi:hypothetical protein